MKTKEKADNCIPCKKRHELTQHDRKIIKEAKQSEPRIEALLRRYGANGVLKLVALHYADLYDTGKDETHHRISAMVGEFSEILTRRINEKVTRKQVKDS